MTFTPEFIVQIAIAAGSAFGVYAAIRADLARAIALAEQASDSASKAHGRIDTILTNH